MRCKLAWIGLWSLVSATVVVGASDWELAPVHPILPPVTRIQPTAKQYYDARRAWMLRELTAAFGRRLGFKDGQLDPASQWCAEDAAYQLTYRVRVADTERRQDVWRRKTRGREVDPARAMLRLWLDGFHGYANRPTVFANACWVEDAGLPSYVAARVLLDAGRWAEEHGARGQAQEAFGRARVQLRAAINEHPDDALFDRIVLDDLEWLTDDLPTWLRYAILEDMEGSPGCSAWLSSCTRGVFLTDEAWKLRGTEYAFKTTAKQFREFAWGLHHAAAALRTAHELEPLRPQAASYMIRVAMAGERRPQEEGAMYWFARSAAAEADFFGAYSSVLWALRPRWGGSEAAMLAFGRACAMSGRYETSAPLMYLRAMAVVAGELNDNDAIMRNRRLNELALMTVQAYEEYDCDYRWYWRSMRAALHAYRGEFEDAREVLESLGTRFDPEGCAYVLADAQSVRREAYGLSGKSGELLLLAQAAADREDWDSVEALIEAARSVHLEGEELIGQNDQIALLELRRSLDVGDVYRATFERGMPGWRLRGGGEGFVGSGKLRPLLSGEGFQAVVPLDLGERYRIGVTIDFECAGANWRAQRAGLIFGYEERGEDQGWMSFWVSAKRRRAYISRGNWDRDEGYSVSTPPLAKKVRLTLDVWDRQVVARLDDQVVFTGPLDFDFERWTPGSRVGLVVPYRPYHPACFSDFTVERLTKAPVELDAPGARRRARAARDRVDLADAPPRIADEPKDKPEVEP